MKKEMPLYRLGSSSKSISAIGLGCWQFSKQKGLLGKFWRSLSDEETLKIVKISKDHGINWFDTAEAYGWGASEISLTKTLIQLGIKKSEIFIATKWWPLFRFASSIKKTIDQRLEMLNGYEINLYQIHQPFSFSSIDQQMQNMADLVEEKKIQLVGVSNFSRKQMTLAHKILQNRSLGVVSNQVNYNLLNRKIESNGVLAAAKDLGITIIAYSPLAQGILSGRFHSDEDTHGKLTGIRNWMPAFSRKGLQKTEPVIRELEKLSKKYDARPAQIALNWLISYNKNLVVAIPGASSEQQAKLNAQSLQFSLSEEDMQKLDQVSKPFV